MVAFAIPWPTVVLPFQSIMFSRGPMSRSGGQSVSGVEQVVVSSADRWKARATVKIHRYEQVLAYRGLMANADGRVGAWLVPSCSGFQILGQGVRGIRPAIGVPTIVNARFSDGATFSDSGEFETKMVMGTVTAAAAKGARSVVVAMNTGTPNPLAGQFFSIGERLYLIASAAGTIGEDGIEVGPWTLSIRPGLRVAAAIGDVTDFSRPACRMRLATDESGELDLDMLRFGGVTLDFFEDPTGV